MPSRSGPGKRRSVASLHSLVKERSDEFSYLSGDHKQDSSSNAGVLGGSSARFSLAHELAVAMMPEPSVGSRLLAEEFGVEFDEGAEGIDEQEEPEQVVVPENTQDDPSFMSAVHHESRSASDVDDGSSFHPRSRSGTPAAEINGFLPIGQAAFATSQSNLDDDIFPSPNNDQSPQDPLEIFSGDLASMDAFITCLKNLDGPPSPNSKDSPTKHPSALSEPAVELYTSNMIRRMNDATRERESQVRELLAIEKEFRKIGNELGGGNVLAALVPLDDTDTPVDNDGKNPPTASRRAHLLPLQGISEEDESNDQDPDMNQDSDADGDEQDENENDVFTNGIRQRASYSVPGLPPSPPRPRGASITPGSATPHLAHVRALTSSIASSLSSLSEHSQENGAATAEAGRMLRALKSKIASLRSDWESADRSREKIERWESGGEGIGVRPVDGRKLVEEQLAGFAAAINLANSRTHAIMVSA